MMSNTRRVLALAFATLAAIAAAAASASNHNRGYQPPPPPPPPPPRMTPQFNQQAAPPMQRITPQFNQQAQPQQRLTPQFNQQARPQQLPQQRIAPQFNQRAMPQNMAPRPGMAGVAGSKPGVANNAQRSPLAGKQTLKTPDPRYVPKRLEGQGKWGKDCPQGPRSSQLGRGPGNCLSNKFNNPAQPGQPKPEPRPTGKLAPKPPNTANSLKLP